jgi:hypothetical protein
VSSRRTRLRGGAACRGGDGAGAGGDVVVAERDHSATVAATFSARSASALGLAADDDDAREAADAAERADVAEVAEAGATGVARGAAGGPRPPAVAAASATPLVDAHWLNADVFFKADDGRPPGDQG